MGLLPGQMWVQVVQIQNQVDMILFYSFGFISGLKVRRMTSAFRLPSHPI